MTAALPPPTPTDQGYTIVKTPRASGVIARSSLASLQQSQEIHSRDAKCVNLVNVAQFLIFVTIGVVVYGQIMVFTDYYNLDLKVTISAWWGVPKAQALAPYGGAGYSNPKGHSELVRPTFVFLFVVLPLVTSVLLVELLHYFNVRRISSKYLLNVARVLRRKPQLPGSSVSPFSYGEWLFFVVFLIGGNILVFYYGFDRRLTSTRASAAKQKRSIAFNEYLDMIAVTLGFNCIYNMVFLFLPATRNSAWMEFLNISYANAVKYHRWLGIVTVLTALAHCVAFYWMWFREGTWRKEALPCFDCSIKSQPGKQVWMNVFGQLALLCFLAIGITSIPWVRRNTYNLFYYVHHLFFLAVVFAVIHWAPIIWWIYPTFTLYLAHRAISSSNAFASVEVKEFTVLSDALIKIVVSRSHQRNGVYKLGQFVYLNVPAISKLQWHAFTIASSPQTSATTMTVLVKALGDWTKDLVAHAEECKQRNVLPTLYVDGFYGTSLELYTEYPTICLVGGGIGVTPLLAILEDIVAKLSHHGRVAQIVHFVFTFRELALLEEIVPLLTRLREFDPQGSIFIFHFSLTRDPGHDALIQPIGTSTRNHVLATHYVVPQKAKSTATKPFAEPLRTRSTRAIMYLSVFFLSFLLVVVLEYGGGKIKSGGRDDLWILQQFAEIAVLFVTALVVYAFVFMEKAVVRNKQASSGAAKLSKDPRGGEDYDVANVNGVSYMRSSVSHTGTTGHLPTFSDLVHAFNVAVGHRQDVFDLLKAAHQTHTAADPGISKRHPIGVFVSGPGALVSATESAIARIGSKDFDIHEEEFEL
uniref:FAD-binding FR-type domain-containing protein n=1 Tax=Globisporangium ultimum (strain ATCC 200006 / CBS 805.95 / DAOM BR144) TaxID=431595 RepID=K3WXH5_GLOUD